jgi:hypothetical protein
MPPTPIIVVLNGVFHSLILFRLRTPPTVNDTPTSKNEGTDLTCVPRIANVLQINIAPNAYRIDLDFPVFIIQNIPLMLKK